MATREKKVAEPARVAPPGRMTYEEFLDWCDEDTLAEWVEGEVVVMSPATSRHQDLVDFFVSLFRFYSEWKRLGSLRSAPFQMKTARHLPGREPDILFVLKKHASRWKKAHLEGPADLVVEVVSPESRRRDRGEKFAEYQEGGVQEYWIVDPDERVADFYVLDRDGRYERVRPDPEGVYASRVLRGFRLRVEWLWAEPLPPLVDVLKYLGVLP